MKVSLFLISLIIRSVQIFFAIIVLGTAAGVVGTGYTTGRAGYNVAVAVLALIYYVITLIPATFPLIPWIASMICETILFLFWLVAFALMADGGFGEVTCVGYVSDNYRTACTTGKAALAFGILSWLVSAASLVLVILYILVPRIKTKSYDMKSNALIGVLFETMPPTKEPVTPADAVVEEEKAVSVSDTTEPVVTPAKSAEPVVEESVEEPVPPAKSAEVPAAEK